MAEHSPENLNKYRYHEVVTVCGQKVIAKVFRSCIFRNGSKEINQSLKDIKIFKTPKDKKDNKRERVGSDYRKWFKSPELVKIDNNDPPEDLDITFLFNILLKHWDNEVKKPSPALEKLLRAIKGERNTVSHEVCKFTQSEFETKLKKYEETLNDCLKEAEKDYPSDKADFTQMRTEIGEDIRKVKEKIREPYDTSMPDDYNKLKEEFKVFVDQLRNDIKEKSRSDLISLYEMLCKILPFDWLPQCDATDPSKIMVSLKMDTDEEFHLSPFAKKSDMLQSEILTTTAPSGDDPDVVIISGDPGTGKTTLSSFITEMWRKGKTDEFPGLSDYDLLFRTEFRRMDVDNFDDYLCKHLQHVVAAHDLQTVKSSILQLKCLFICDGFDERNPKSQKLFKEILELQSPGMKIIITSRPIYTKELNEIVNYSCRSRINLSLVGLGNQSQQSLITKIINYLEKDDTERKKFVDGITNEFQSMPLDVKQMMKNPLYLNLYSILWIKITDLRGSVTTVTKLFAEINKHSIKRLVHKLRGKEEKVLEFEKFYKLQSLKSHLRKKYELTEGDIKVYKEKCNKLGLPFETVMSSFFNVKNSLKSLDIVTIYCYKHRTEQEFSAAGAICDAIADPVYQDMMNSGNIIYHILLQLKQGMKEDDSEGESSSSDDEDSVKKSIQQILGFVSGLLYKNDRKLLGRVAKDIVSMIHREYEDSKLCIDYYVKHITETEMSSSVSNVVVSILEDEREKGWCVRDPASLLHTQALISKKPSSLKLELKDDPDTLPDLIPTIKATATNAVPLELHLNSHMGFKVKGYSDPYFKEGCRNMLSFKGRLSKNTIKDSLKESKIMKRLFLRLEDMEAYEEFNRCLPSLTTLSVLRLGFSIHESPDPKLTPLEFTGDRLSIAVALLSKGDTTSEQLAIMMNTLWRHRRTQAIGRERTERMDGLGISNSRFGKAEVEQFITTIEGSLMRIGIYGTIDITKEERVQLERMAKSRGHGRLRMF